MPVDEKKVIIFFSTAAFFTHVFFITLLKHVQIKTEFKPNAKEERIKREETRREK